MENAADRNKQTAKTPGIAGTLWDPFWFMREMLNWGRSAGAPSFDVKETKDSYVYKVNVKLTLPQQADVARVKAEMENGELTLVVPKVAPGKPEPMSPLPLAPKAAKAEATSTSSAEEPKAAAKPEETSPPPRARRKTGSGRGAAGRKARRGARAAAR